MAMRRLLLPVIAVALCGTAIGAAASLPFATAGLGAARVVIPRCTTGSLSVAQNLSGNNVISVTVSGLPSACAGATLQAAVNNGSVSSSGSATIPGGGGSVTVILASAVAASTTEQTDLVVVGP
ncbi:MAG TPA: hypothetical protein VH371_11670 [Candidatus Limnocylindrales bacterium]|jgi:hypothetical protein